MARKGLLITPDICIGCRACQVACKEWNQLPASKTKNYGTYENPPDLDGNTYNKIRFIEHKDLGISLALCKSTLHALWRACLCSDMSCWSIDER